MQRLTATLAIAVASTSLAVPALAVPSAQVHTAAESATESSDGWDQTPEEFRSALGVPIEDAGGGEDNTAVEATITELRKELRASGITVDAVARGAGKRSIIIILPPGERIPSPSLRRDVSVQFVHSQIARSHSVEVQHRISAENPQWRSKGLAIWGVGINDLTGKIEVSAESANARAADEFTSQYGKDAELKIENTTLDFAGRSTDSAPVGGGM